MINDYNITADLSTACDNLMLINEMKEYLDVHPNATLEQYVEWFSNKGQREYEIEQERIRKAKQYNDEHYVNKYLLCITKPAENDFISGLSYYTIYIIDKIQHNYVFQYDDSHLSNINVKNWRIDVNYVDEKWGRHSSHISCPWDCISGHLFYNPEFNKDCKNKIIEIDETTFKSLTSIIDNVYHDNKTIIDSIVEKYETQFF